MVMLVSYFLYLLWLIFNVLKQSITHLIIEKNVKEILPHKFAIMCASMLNYALPFEKFLDGSRAYVLENINNFDMMELGYIVGAYAVVSENPQANADIISVVEQQILSNTKKISYKAATNLMVNFLRAGGSEDLWLVLDVVIGKNLRQISDQEIVPILGKPYKQHFCGSL